VAAGTILDVGGEHLVHRESYLECVRAVEERIRRATEESGALSVSVGDVRKGLDWPAPLWERVQGEIVSGGLAIVRDGRFALRTSRDDLPPDDRILLERMLRIYEETGCRSPRPEELPELLGTSPAKTEGILERLCNEGELLRLAKNVVMARSAFKGAQDALVRTLREKGELDSSEYKHHIRSTRKYALAILDYLDARNVTVRIGNVRKLAPNHERNLI
jgi:hypothetical protein